MLVRNANYQAMVESGVWSRPTGRLPGEPGQNGGVGIRRMGEHGLTASNKGLLLLEGPCAKTSRGLEALF